MKCQYCDSLIKPVPGNGICPNCGGALGQRKPVVTIARPKWTHKDVSGRIAFNEEAVLFYGDILLETKDVLIPYDEVVAVLYNPGTFWEKGFLSVRGMQNRYKPLPQNTKDALRDDTSIAFSDKHKDKFLYAYRFLKQYADRNKELEE